MNHTTLGRYRILDELGRGAIGTVYRAHDPLIEREVAVKTLHPNLSEEVIAEARPRFLREAKSAGRLNHPNIVTIFDVGEQDGVAYIAMELLQGRSLRLILAGSARLPFQTIADYAAQIADALDCAQGLGIVHRDVKPANVVVSASGHVKLTDFGVAYVPSSSMTQPGTVIGSPRYMSPEQVLGQPIDPRSDIFSLGVLLYEMLAGCSPFIRPGDSTIFPLIHRIPAEPHPPVTEKDPSIPAAFEMILSRALAKKPGDRYQRAGEMANDLRNWRSLQPPRPAAAPVDYEKTLVLPHGPQTLQRQYEKLAVVPVAVVPVKGSPAYAPPAGRIEPRQEKAADLPPQEQAASAPSKIGSETVSKPDALARGTEAGGQARQQAEKEERRKKDEELRRWREEVARKREAAERRRESEAQRNALDPLKTKGPAHPSGEDPATKADRARAILDQSMRAALEHLSEVARELNAANPLSGRPYDYVFLGPIPAVKLSNAVADLRSRDINGADRGYLLVFGFRAKPATPATTSLRGADISRFSEFLKMLSIPFELKTETKSRGGQATRAAFTVSAPLPCELKIRADYEDFTVEIELVNVRRSGRVRCTVDPRALDGVVDDLARYLLGVDDDFDKVLNRR